MCALSDMQESYTGKGLYPGEAYAPNTPSLIEAAAMVPAAEGAVLIKLANALSGAPQVLAEPSLNLNTASSK